MIFTRAEFKEQVRSFTWDSHSDLTADDSPLWMLERHNQLHPEWFVCVEQDVVKESSEVYWNWCDRYLSGKLICYLSSCVNGEWWGFTNKEDIVLWTLRWA